MVARPGLKRTGPVGIPRPRQGSGSGPGSRDGACGHGFPNRARAKYPKGTPFVPIFLYLYTSIVHPLSNVGLNAFNYI